MLHVLLTRAFSPFRNAMQSTKRPVSRGDCSWTNSSADITSADTTPSLPQHSVYFGCLLSASLARNGKTTTLHNVAWPCMRERGSRLSSVPHVAFGKEGDGAVSSMDSRRKLPVMIHVPQQLQAVTGMDHGESRCPEKKRPVACTVCMALWLSYLQALLDTRSFVRRSPVVVVTVPTYRVWATYMILT